MSWNPLDVPSTRSWGRFGPPHRGRVFSASHGAGNNRASRSPEGLLEVRSSEVPQWCGQVVKVVRSTCTMNIYEYVFINCTYIYNVYEYIHIFKD